MTRNEAGNFPVFDLQKKSPARYRGIAIINYLEYRPVDYYITTIN